MVFSEAKRLVSAYSKSDGTVDLLGLKVLLGSVAPGTDLAPWLLEELGGHHSVPAERLERCLAPAPPAPPAPQAPPVPAPTAVPLAPAPVPLVAPAPSPPASVRSSEAPGAWASLRLARPLTSAAELRETLARHFELPTAAVEVQGALGARKVCLKLPEEAMKSLVEMRFEAWLFIG